MILIYWMDDWFVARLFQSDKTSSRCWIQAADDPKYEAMGFERRGKLDRHYYGFFEKDPGFKYSSDLKYKGCSVGLSSIHPDATPREVSVHNPVRPPDAEDWKYDARDGYDRYVKVDELEKVEIEPPDWSQITQ